MADVNEIFEAKHLAHIRKVNNQIKNLYNKAISEVTLKASKIKFNGVSFKLSDHPDLQKQVNNVIKKLQGNIFSTIHTSLGESWKLSNTKNDFIVDKRLAGKNPSKFGKQLLYDPNLPALKKFQDRKEKGLNLSQRVWNTLEPVKSQMELGLGLGISEGKSAAKMAKDLKQFLNEPDKLFRRVRNAEGKLELSRSAKNYHPGQGVYRSSYKNAYRLSRTENNMAYRTADFDRWSRLPFVVGIRVKLSNNHPKFDICDDLQGKYPKDFLFRGWHPQCICYAIPEMMSDKEYDRLEDQILNGEDISVKSVNTVKKPHPGFEEWLKKNSTRINGWKNKPYWTQDNQKYVKHALKQKHSTSPANPKYKIEPKPAPTPTPTPPTPAPGITEKLETPAATVPIPARVEKIPAYKELRAIGPQMKKIEKTIKSEVREALDAIDKVHGDGKLPNIPIQEGTSGPNTMGEFWSTGGKAWRMTLRKTAPHPELTVIHEMGHFLDLEAIFKKRSFASMQIRKGNPMKEVMEAIKRTDAHTTLLRTQKFLAGTDGERFVNYLLNEKELWARSYAQYIAKKSGSPKLLRQLNENRQNARYPTQWADVDFENIEKAIDKMFSELGWINQ